jgi:hypothetical protein
MATATTTPPVSPAPATAPAPKARTLVRCARHRELDADVRCDKCRTNWCFGCVTSGEDRGVKWIRCKCSGRCDPLAREHEVKAQRELESRAFGLLAYPVRGEGVWLLAVGAFCFGLFDLCCGSGVRALLEMFSTMFVAHPAAGDLSFSMTGSSLGLVVAILLLGFQFSWVMRVVQTTAQGRDEAPGFPDFVSVAESMVLPVGRVLAVLGLTIGPGLIALPFGLVGALFGVVLLIAGVFTLPMALTSIAIADSLEGLDVPRIFRSIRCVGLPYLAAAALFFAILALLFAGTAALGFAGPIAPFARAALALYLAAIAGRVLGLLYAKHERELAWYTTPRESERR